MDCIDHGKHKSLHEFGYAFVHHEGKTNTLHRVVLARKLGKSVSELGTCRHTCDNPRCVNPEHLEEGTQADNVMDMWKRGRHVVVSGEAHYSTNLTQADVDAIRTRFVPRCKTNGGTALAAEYRISKQTVCDIVKRRIWK